MLAGIAIYLCYGRGHSVLANREAGRINKDTALDPASP
jgi:hypothetical protein